MNVNLHLHKAERPAVSCSELSTGATCLQINTTRGDVSVFGTLAQIEALYQSIALALYPELTDEADIHSEG